ncbi:GNAT family N-acetyltransferase [Streptomyces sp. PR69]|uniref:GNAT family N-acetyltransferase n=1 Tax=Streptomyces sp. PR69 TaxID=2984950 RepID=UPI002264350E|nr:GNAT family N-acetyltransferase [Streptomyces sp. PR69]
MAQDRAEVQVRAGTETDLEALVELYNHYVSETAVTFDTVPLTPEQRRPWLHSHPEDGPHRLLVAQDVRSGRILGYAASSPLSPKPAYATSVEVSVYCAPDTAGRGVGTRLYEALFQALEGEDVHRAYAGIAQPNEASTRLHTRFGFKEAGRYGEVGRKFGAYWDVVWYEKELRPREPGGPGSPSAPAPDRGL